MPRRRRNKKQAGGQPATTTSEAEASGSNAVVEGLGGEDDDDDDDDDVVLVWEGPRCTDLPASGSRSTGLPNAMSLGKCSPSSNTSGSRSTGSPNVLNEGFSGARTSGSPNVLNEGSSGSRTSESLNVLNEGSPSSRTSGSPNVLNEGSPGSRTSGSPNVLNEGSPGSRTSGSPNALNEGSGSPNVLNEGSPSWPSSRTSRPPIVLNEGSPGTNALGSLSTTPPEKVKRRPGRPPKSKKGNDGNNDKMLGCLKNVQSQAGGMQKRRANLEQEWSVTNADSKPIEKPEYSYKTHATEDHGNPIYGCQFHIDLKEGEPLIFATVGSNRASVYKCDPGGSIVLLQCFEDPDSSANKKYTKRQRNENREHEEFYTCAWSDIGGGPLLAVAGKLGIIRILSTSCGKCIKDFTGHGSAINDLTFHPKQRALLLSASKDLSLRLWNLKTEVLVAIFGGVDGHRDEVLAADFNLRGTCVVSCGMDHCLKVWDFTKPEIEKAMRDSHLFDTSSGRSIWRPDISTRDIHENYIDCAKWFGSFVFSKSCDNEIVCWDPSKVNPREPLIIATMDIENCELWFMKFSIDFSGKRLALGNQAGKAYIYSLDGGDPENFPTAILSHTKCNAPIRQTAFSRDGNVLIFVCSDGTIWRWDRVGKSHTTGVGDKLSMEKLTLN